MSVFEKCESLSKPQKVICELSILSISDENTNQQFFLTLNDFPFCHQIIAKESKVDDCLSQRIT